MPALKLQNLLVLAFLLVLTACATKPVAKDEGSFRCPICNMKVTSRTKTSFQSVRNEKPVHFCSFSCAHRFHKQHPTPELFARDFETGEAIASKEAFFLIRSQNVLKELEFDMPPPVVAFSTEDSAARAKLRLQDGEVVKGFEAVEAAHE